MEEERGDGWRGLEGVKRVKKGRGREVKEVVGEEVERKV